MTAPRGTVARTELVLTCEECVERRSRRTQLLDSLFLARAVAATILGWVLLAAVSAFIVGSVGIALARVAGVLGAEF